MVLSHPRSLGQCPFEQKSTYLAVLFSRVGMMDSPCSSDSGTLPSFGMGCCCCTRWPGALFSGLMGETRKKEMVRMKKTARAVRMKNRDAGR